jgi:uncharacterized protein YceK
MLAVVILPAESIWRCLIKQPMLIILAICTITLSGCGTFADMMCGPGDDKVFYRGVRMDVESAKEGGRLSVMVADIPFSAVADTLLIPFLAYAETTRPPLDPRRISPIEQPSEGSIAIPPPQK